jgi:stage V sporulation protein B
MGRPEIAMRNLLITGILKVIFIFTLTGMPALNVRGAAIGTVLAFLIGSSLNIFYLQKITGISYEIGRLAKIALVTIIMALAVKYSYQFVVGMDIRSHLATVIAIMLGVGVYGVLLFLIRELDLNMVKRLLKS